MKALITEISNSKEVQTQVIADYTAGKLKDLDLTIGEATGGQASGITDDTPLDMGQLVRGQGGQRLRQRFASAAKD